MKEIQYPLQEGSPQNTQISSKGQKLERESQGEEQILGVGLIE